MHAGAFQVRGFTLMELLMVMAIIAICAALIAPRLGDFTVGRSSSNAARSIVSMATYARAQAIGEGRTYRLNYDASAHQFFVTVQDAGNYVAPTNELGQKLPVPDGVEAEVTFPKEQDGTYVQFLPTGRSEQAQVRLTDRLRRVVEVACNSPTELFHIVPSAEVQR